MWEYLRENEIEAPLINLLNAGYANTLCADLETLSAHSSAVLDLNFAKYGNRRVDILGWEMRHGNGLRRGKGGSKD